jgi:hydrogenase nickel incorporation protein HypA/HybF
VHELSYCEGVLEAVLRRAGERRVSAVAVRIGAVHRVVADAFQQSFEIAAAGTVAEGARTELTVLPVHGHCLACRSGFDAADPAPACPACGSLEVAVEGGDEVVLEWVAYAADAADLAGLQVHEHRHELEEV